MTKPRTHDENRLQICLLCFGKTKTMHLIKGACEILIRKHFEYDKADDRLPLVLCSGCKRDLYRIEDTEEKTIRLPDVSELRPIKKNTRSNSKLMCDCCVCELARKPAFGNLNFAKGNVLPARKSILADTTNVQIKGIVQ